MSSFHIHRVQHARLHVHHESINANINVVYDNFQHFTKESVLFKFPQHLNDVHLLVALSPEMEIIWQYGLPSRITETPIITDGGVMIVTCGDTVYALGDEQGK